MNLQELRVERKKIIDEARKLLEKTQGENRQFTDEENTHYDGLIAKQQELQDQIIRAERQEQLDREMAGQAAISQVPVNSAPGREEIREMSELLRRDITPQDFILQRKQMEGFRNLLRDKSTNEEFRALQADVDVSGGYLVVPEVFIAQLIKDIDDQVFVRPNATTFPVVDSESLGAPSLDADPADSDWTSEIDLGTEDSTMVVGKRKLTPHPVRKLIKVSEMLLMKSAIPAEALVRDRLSYKNAITQEKAFLTGSGANQPLGVFTASAAGISTSQDFGNGTGENSTTAITFNGLIGTKYALKPGYAARARWLFHRDAMKMISKLVDGNGQYLWRPSVREGEPDTILGRPVDQSEYAPNTFTTGLYVGMFCDWSYYWIADSMAYYIRKLMELYAGTGQVGFVGYGHVDGMPVLENAFARIKLA